MRIADPDEARQEFLAAFSPAALEFEGLPSETALGRLLARDVTAGDDIPNHQRSTMDGYAVRATDTFGAQEGLPVYLRLVGEVRVGNVAPGPIGPGETMWVPTGGMLPPGADAAVKLEEAQRLEGEVEFRRPAAPGQNVIRRGEDVAAGQILLTRGQRLRSQDIGLLAAAGVLTVTAVRPPRVAILSTGDEVVPPEATPGPGQVRDANGPALVAAVRADGGEPFYFGITGDEPAALEAALRKALQHHLVLISGGSSAGTRDFTLACLSTLGEPGVLVHGVAVKPGKPTALAVINGIPVVGLPGHPVSALVIYRLFGRPALRRLMGLPAARWEGVVRARLTANVPSEAGRDDYVRVALLRRDGEVWAEPQVGKSGLLSTLTRADGLIMVPRDLEGIAAGTWVEVWPDPRD